MHFDLPSVSDAAGVKTAHMNLLKSVAAGTLTPEEAHAVSELLTLQLKMVAEGDANGQPRAGPGVALRANDGETSES